MSGGHTARGITIMNLVDRVKNILVTPRTEWLVIEGERGDPAYLFTNYVAILAAIPAICNFIGTTLVGISVPTVGTFRLGIGAGIVNMILTYVLSFVIVYLVALITDALAPTFGGQKNFENSMKLVTYSYTPGWLVGIFALIPALGFLGILGLYGLYLFWTGVSPLMKTPANRSSAYTATVVVCTIVIAIVLGLIQAWLIGIPRT
jgi:hypothetical protein